MEYKVICFAKTSYAPITIEWFKTESTAMKYFYKFRKNMWDRIAGISIEEWRDKRCVRIVRKEFYAH